MSPPLTPGRGPKRGWCVAASLPVFYLMMWCAVLSENPVACPFRSPFAKILDDLIAQKLV